MNKYAVRITSRWPGVFNRWILLQVLLLVFAVIAIYGQSLWFGYVNYDDTLILDKRWIAYRELSWEGLRKIFTPRGMATYQPLRHLAFALVYRFSGTDPGGYHLLNLLLYLANLLVVFFLLRKLLELSTDLGRGRAGFWAWLGTLWFAVHPVHVESVAWMISNKELLAGLFFFLAFLSYIKSRQGGFAIGHYLASWLFLLLGLLSKPSVAALPLVVVAFEFLYPRKDANLKGVSLKIAPFLALVALAAAYYVFRSSAFTGSFLQGSVSVHFLTISSVLAKYVKNLILPVNLSHSYPPPFFSGEYNWRLAVYLAIDLLLIAMLTLSIVKRERAVAFGILFFLLNLLPVSGLLPISIFMADRYLYLSSFGFVFVGVLVMIRFREVLANRETARRLFVFAGSVTLILLALLSFDRCRVWKDALTLWTNAVRTYPNFQFNHYGLGNAYFKSGQLEQALKAYKTANLFRENFSTTYYIARVYDELGDSAEATRYYSKVLNLYTDDMTNQPEIISRTYEQLGMKEELARLLLSRGKRLADLPQKVEPIARRLFNLGYPEYAIEVLTEAAAKAPPSAGLKTSLAEILALRGDLAGTERAIKEAHAAGENPARLVPLEADLLFASGNWQKAAFLYESAGVETLSRARKENLAAGYFSSGDHRKALAIFRKLAAEAGQPVASAHNNIGVVLEAMDSLEAAENEYLRAVKLKPDYADAWFNLGNLAQKKGELGEAVECYSRTREIEGSSIDVENAIAAVLIELGRYEEAFKAFVNIIQIDSTAGAAYIGAGDAAWELGKIHTAEKYYRNYLDRFSRDEAPARLLKRILPGSKN